MQRNKIDMKYLLILVLCFPLVLMAQKPQYKIHKVEPRESFTSIGRLYNINGRELANYNNLDYDKGLSIGQELKIPVKNVQAQAPVTVKKEEPAKKPVVVAPQSQAKDPSGGTPVYHTVGKKETLYHISTLYNKVPIADLKKWNNLSGDGLNEGMKLIVGYSDKPQMEVAMKEPEKPSPVIVKEPATPQKEIEKPKETIPAPKAQPARPPVKEEPIRVSAGVAGGAFKSIFATQGRSTDYVSESGVGGIFKSNSGWEDGKYYCLHNSAAQGSIAKITNNTNGKTIYAKVLDVIPDIKQNEGVIVRISNAAADELGVAGNATFDCSIMYLR